MEAECSGLQCLNFHFVLAWPEAVVCSRGWAGDALSSSEQFSESFFPTLKYFTASEQIFNGRVSDVRRRLTYRFQRQKECLAGTANWFPICKWTFGHRLFQEYIQRVFFLLPVQCEMK